MVQFAKRNEMGVMFDYVLYICSYACYDIRIDLHFGAL